MKKLFFMIFLIFLGCGSGGNSETNNTTEKIITKGFILPAYFYDDKIWDKVTKIDINNQIIILNPNNGPGDKVSSHYQNILNNLTNQKPIGYVYTKWGTRNINDVKNDIDKWIEFYPNIQGFFFDEAATTEDKLSYYKELFDYVKNKKNYFIVLNPGTKPNNLYFNYADNIVVYEDTNLTKAISSCTRDKTSVILYDANVSDMKQLVNANCDYFYVTDDNGSNPYDTLPSYLDDELNEINNSVSYFHLNLRRSLYIWSTEFSLETNKELETNEEINKINLAILSITNDANITKTKDFLAQNPTSILISDNRWIYEDQRDIIDAKFDFLSQFDDYYIHLDVEPQAMDDLKDNEEKYLQMYLDMLQYIKSNYPQYKIDISIPTSYDLSYVKKMSKYVNKICLMAYEYTSIDQLIRRVNYYKDLKSQIVVVFNSKNFNTKNQLFNDIKSFSEKSGYNDISIYSLKYFNNLQ